MADKPSHESTLIPNKTVKTKAKRLPQGQRKHVRRLKQAARKVGRTPG